MSYKVPFVDLPKNFKKLKSELAPLLEDIIFERADFIMRGDLKKFEENAANYIGSKYAVGLNSGTDALFLSLLAAGVGRGDEVITVAHTFVATVAAIHFTGATPVLVDVASDHNMNVDQIESLLSEKTKAIIPVHLNGRMCNMSRILEIAEKYSLIVIEDACQSWGATYKNKIAGSFGLTGCFSLYPMKILGGIGDGGILATNYEEIVNKVRLYRDHSLDRTTMELINFGFNSRLDNVNAAICDVKLRHLPDYIRRRREIAKLYDIGLKDLEGITLPLPYKDSGDYYDVYQNYIITCKERDDLVTYFGKKGIEILISWKIPLHYHKNLQLSHYSLPMTEKISKEVVSLPMNTEVTDEQVQYVIQTIKSFFKK